VCGPQRFRTIQIAHAIGDTTRQIALQARSQLEFLGVFCKRDKYIVQSIFSDGSVVRQSDSQREQLVFVLLIDPPQSVSVSTLQFQQEQLVFQHASPA
jgi:hypothetical protein